ncbi:DUF4238 domain-containing protein [Lentzea sp. BCCO 10_0856]|uniref:DUF4238 domain-containing protein n=1 Tax=Lentzea miocenica TaxID=3095431 RepID=A0ABU4SUA2_9PSEU|nr:DUF4238 domain-containing protein [Lentzea sp. BCCO 10_0856]MDX8029397.1 DUF4238 domain-containing protein [Lentzea sp. BCCO 10_0856]
MAKLVRRQHVVSQFYLKGFANEANQLRRVVLPGDKSHIVSSSDASVIRDFYTVTLPDGSQSDIFERTFSEIEKPAADALRSVREGEWSLRDEPRAALSLWIALQHLRGEDVRSSQTQFKATLIRLTVGVSGKAALREIIEKAEARTISDEELEWEWQDLTKPGGPTLMPEINGHLKVLMSLHNGMSRYLYDAHWTVFRFTRRALVTSDRPVAMTVAPDYPPEHGVGIFTADAFLVPLSRRAAVMIQPRDRTPDANAPDFEIAGTAMVARSINQEIVRHASRSIYHHPDDSPLEGLYLPQPGRRDPNADIGSGLIKEEGLFAGLSKEQLKAFSPPSPSANDSKGMTIKDLPWPIPGRIKPER